MTQHISTENGTFSDFICALISRCGAVAFLIGKNAVLPLEHGTGFESREFPSFTFRFVGLRASHFEHAYDFYKPNLSSPYPGSIYIYRAENSISNTGFPVLLSGRWSLFKCLLSTQCG